MRSTQTSRYPNRPRRTLALWVIGLCAVALALTVGCAQKGPPPPDTTTLGDWPDRELPLVIAGDPERGAGALTASEAELSEAQWKVLEEFAPRNTWNRLRQWSNEVRQVRASAGTAKAATSQPALKLPDVPFETLPDGKIQMYYRVRHFGGVTATASPATGTSRRTITIAPGGTLDSLAALVTARLLATKGTVKVMPTRNMLIITCDPAARKSVLELLARIDVPMPQVEISARIFEANHEMDFQAGVKMILKHLGSNRQFGATHALSAENFVGKAVDPLAGTVPDPGAAMRIVNLFNSTGYSTDLTVQALSMTGLIKIVSSPRMTVTVGKTGYVHAGQELPIASAKLSNDKLLSEKTTYRPIGVQLYVTPEIVADGTVKLHVVTVVSSISGFQQMASLTEMAAPTVNPVFDVREAETHVTVRDGSALVIGGLRQVRNITREDKVPFLGDIPGLGWLFKNHRSQKQISDLYFFITPRIIKP